MTTILLCEDCRAATGFVRGQAIGGVLSGLDAPGCQACGRKSELREYRLSPVSHIQLARVAIRNQLLTVVQEKRRSALVDKALAGAVASAVSLVLALSFGLTAATPNTLGQALYPWAAVLSLATGAVHLSYLWKLRRENAEHQIHTS